MEIFEQVKCIKYPNIVQQIEHTRMLPVGTRFNLDRSFLGLQRNEMLKQALVEMTNSVLQNIYYVGYYNHTTPSGAQYPRYCIIVLVTPGTFYVVDRPAKWFYLFGSGTPKTDERTAEILALPRFVENVETTFDFGSMLWV